MTAIPRYRPHQGPALLSAGFRPFFLLAGLAAAVAIPLWLLAVAGIGWLPSAFPPLVWHVHEMVFGFGLATLGGFLFTAIPNWTGRMPLQGPALGWLAGLWALGRAAVFCSAWTGEGLAAPLDLAFPATLAAIVAREVLYGRNWRNLPILAALGVLLTADLWVHLGVLGLVLHVQLGNRLGVAVLLMLISLMGGRLIPSFTRNWLARTRPADPLPAPFGGLDRVALGVTALALLAWVLAPDAEAHPGPRSPPVCCCSPGSRAGRAGTLGGSRCCSCCISATLGWRSGSWSSGSFAQWYVMRHGPADGFLPCGQCHLIRRAWGVPPPGKRFGRRLTAVQGPDSSYHARDQSVTDQVGRPPRGFDRRTDPLNGGSLTGPTT